MRKKGKAKDKKVSKEKETKVKEDKKKDEEVRLPYSYHTFMYPFSYHSKSGEVNSLNEDDGWIKEEWVDTLKVLDVGNGKKEYDSEQIWMYNTYQYFFPKVRRNLFNMPNEDTSTGIHYQGNSCKISDSPSNEDTPTSIHYRYRFPDEVKGQKTGCSDSGEKKFTKKYIIQKGIGTAKPWKVELEINNITLSIYPKLEIGVLTIETEYYPSSKIDAFQNAFKINDYGRRIFTPSVNYPYVENEGMIKDRLTSIYMTADKITLFLGKNRMDKIEIDFPELLKKKTDFKFSQDKEIYFIKKIIGDNTYGKFGEMTSILDDRMFVACLIRDEQVSDIPVGRILNGDISEPRIRSMADRLYNFVFLDGGSTTCQSDRMLVQKLNEHIYDRWINEGTFHGVTEYSMICGTGSAIAILNPVIMPFLVQYVRMVKLALVQRSEIVKLENEVCSIKLPGTGELSSENVEAIRNIWKKYVIFQNELYLPEVTFQEQGVELYSMLKKSLKIDELIERLDGELANLKDLAQMEAEREEKNADDRINRALNLLSVVGFTLALASLTQDFIGAMGFSYSMSGNHYSMLYYGLTFAFLGIVSAVLSHSLNGKYDSKKTWSEQWKELPDKIRGAKWEICIWILIVLMTGILFFGVFRSNLKKDDVPQTEGVCNCQESMAETE